MYEVGSRSPGDPEGCVNAGFNLGHEIGDGTFFDVMLLIMFYPEISNEEHRQCQVGLKNKHFLHWRIKFSINRQLLNSHSKRDRSYYLRLQMWFKIVPSTLYYKHWWRWQINFKRKANCHCRRLRSLNKDVFKYILSKVIKNSHQNTFLWKRRWHPQEWTQHQRSGQEHICSALAGGTVVLTARDSSHTSPSNLDELWLDLTQAGKDVRISFCLRGNRIITYS